MPVEYAVECRDTRRQEVKEEIAAPSLLLFWFFFNAVITVKGLCMNNSSWFQSSSFPPASSRISLLYPSEVPPAAWQ